MKQLVFIILTLTFLSGLLFADDYIIGNGSSTEYYVPFNGSNDYGWSKICFSQAEVAGSGMTNGAQITKLALYVDNAIENYVTDNQSIYIGAFYNSIYGSIDTSFPNTSSYTQVYNGSITWNGPGWVEIPLSQSYTWNSSWGLEILWSNQDGTRLSPYPKFRYTNVSNTLSINIKTLHILPQQVEPDTPDAPTSGLSLLPPTYRIPERP